MNKSPNCKKEPITFPKININYRSKDNNNVINIKKRKPESFSNTSNIFFNQNIGMKNNLSTKILKIKKKKINSETEEILEEQETKQKNKEGINNDSFMNEIEILLTNVNPKDQDEDAKSVEEDTPDPRINFEHINNINKSRPQTSYGGLMQRKNKLLVALKNDNINKYDTQSNFIKHAHDVYSNKEEF